MDMRQKHGTGRAGSGPALPDGPADEERTQTVEIERSLLRLAHRLDDGGEREEILTDEPDDEVVVVTVESVAGKADVVDIVRSTEGHADRAVLGEDRPLLVGGQLREPAAPAQWIPDGPRPVAVQYSACRTIDQGVAEVRLVSERIRTAEHGVLRLERELGTGPLLKRRADAIHEAGGCLGERQDGNASWIVDILVHDAGDAGALQMAADVVRLAAAAERQQ